GSGQRRRGQSGTHGGGVVGRQGGRSAGSEHLPLRRIYGRGREEISGGKEYSCSAGLNLAGPRGDQPLAGPRVTPSWLSNFSSRHSCEPLISPPRSWRYFEIVWLTWSGVS